MRIAREGIPFVLGLFALGAILGLVARTVVGTSAWGAAIVATPGAALGLFSLWFFRDPDRAGPSDPELVVAPADGRVVAAHDGQEGPMLAIFLSVFDVHVNRSPIAGRVEAVSHRPGRFLAAFDERAGEENERTEIVIRGRAGDVRVRQIAGLIARRIVCRVRPGDSLSRGERFGLIRFGSRTDLRLPAGAKLTVGVGERVRGGESVVGRMPASPDLQGPPALAAQSEER